MRLARHLPLRLRQSVRQVLDELSDLYATKSYSQEGEDMILRRMFERKNGAGFYVDVGAHHPRRFSNTYFFYKRGWRGINIEPNPDSISLFQTDRRGDINIQLGVSDCASLLRYHIFDEPALNTFDEELATSRLATSSYKRLRIVDVRVEPLSKILTDNLPTAQEIDFLSIDVEGLDYKVLRSNDWERFRPECVLVEALRVPLERIKDSEVFLFMQRQSYELLAKTFNTLIFKKKR